jgi:hypothetical protein
MQADIDTLAWGSGVRLFGINYPGSESANAAATAGRTIPWLQGTPDQVVWFHWQVEYRDVVILDPRNVPVARFSLTTFDLGNPADYDSLKTLLSGHAP